MLVSGTDRRRWPVRRHFRCLEGDRQFCVVADPSQLDAFETLCLAQRALPAAIEVQRAVNSRALRLAAPRVEGHNFDSSNCCRSPIHILARSASSLLAWSALPRAL